MLNIFDTTVSSLILFLLAGLSTGTGGVLLLISYLKTDKIQRKAAANGEKKGQELLDKFGGQDRLDNIVIGSFDNYKKMAEVDALVRGKGCIISLEIKSWSGKIFPDTKNDEWKIETKKGIVKRRNPIKQSERHASIIKEFYPGIRVIPMVLILGWNEMEGDIPDGVITYKTAWKIDSILKKMAPEDNENTVSEVWDKIVTDEYSEKSEARAKNYLKKIRKKYHSPRPWINALIASICFIFIALATIYNAYKTGIF